jgi:hypothetical protein
MYLLKLSSKNIHPSFTHWGLWYRFNIAWLWGESCSLHVAYLGYGLYAQVPHSCKNLLHIKQNLFEGCISDQGYAIEFINSTCVIRDMQTHTILGKGHRIKKKWLYRLKVESLANVKTCSVKHSYDVKRSHQFPNFSWDVQRTWFRFTKATTHWSHLWHLSDWETIKEVQFSKNTMFTMKSS